MTAPSNRRSWPIWSDGAEVATKSEEVLSKTPEGKVLRLRRQLHEAVADEHFEEAARLRDEIRRLSDDEGLAARA